MFAFRRPSHDTLQRLFASQAVASPSYPEIGASMGEFPPGYHHDRLEAIIGNGHDLFRKAADHLDAWGLQRSMGFDVHPDTSHVEDGETVLLTVPVGPMFFVASTRVIYRTVEPNHHGFAYGTLPSHPEIGEEYFGVSIDENDVVRFEVKAFSRPGALVARLGGPVGRMVQARAMRQYLQAMEDFGR